MSGRSAPPSGSVQVPCSVRLKAGLAIITCSVPRSLPISCVDVDCQPTQVIIDTTKFKRKPIYVCKSIPHNAKVIPETAEARLEGNRLVIEAEIAQTEEQKRKRQELREKRADDKRQKRVRKSQATQARLRRERELQAEAEAQAKAAASSKRQKGKSSKKKRKASSSKPAEKTPSEHDTSMRILEQVAQEHDEQKADKLRKEKETAEWQRLKDELAKKKKVEKKKRRSQMAAKLQNEQLVSRVLHDV